MKSCLLFLGALLAHSAWAAGEPTPKEIEALLRTASATSRAERAVQLSAALLGRPYELGPCGEGDAGHFDKKPLTRFDRFDCTTYVEAVLALSSVERRSREPADLFFDHLKGIKYSDANQVSFTNRNHFTESDWIPNAVAKGYLIDITQTLYPTAPERMRWSDVGLWFKQKVLAVEAGSAPNKEHQLVELTTQGSSNSGLNADGTRLGRLRYIPLTGLLTSSVKRQLIEEKITVFNLVKNEHTRLDIPTLVAHQGFIIVKAGMLYLRHASSASDAQKTIDVPFESYVRERMLDTTWPTLGMHILRIAP